MATSLGQDVKQETVISVTADEDEPKDDDSEDSISYQIIKEYSEKLAPFLESACTRFAAKLSAENFIDDTLKDEIILKRLAPSNWDRMQTLLTYIYRRMKQSKNPEKLMKDFKEVINDNSGLVKRLDRTLAHLKGKVDNPEAAAIDKISSDIADLLQGSIIQFATRANSKKLLSDEQKNAAFPQSQHETHYTAKLLDIVANTIKMDDEDQKFEAFLTILRHDLGGPLITLSHKMKEEKLRRQRQLTT